MSSDRRLDPLAVVATFGLPNAVVQSVHAGFSGATVFRVASGDAHFALKAYPADWGDAARLSELHRHVASAGTDLMPPMFPARFGATVVEVQDRLWELAEWRVGQPISNETIALAIEACAKLHLRWLLPALAAQPCPTVVRQWAVLDEWQEADVNQYLDGELSKASSLLERLLAPTRDALRPWLIRPVPVQIIHGDLWTGNVLIHNGRVSGIIDCAAMRVDSVVGDLARLCGTTSIDINRHIVEQYEPQRLLQPAEWELLHTLGRSGPVARLAQWLKWLVVQRREFADPYAARRRFEEVISQARLCE
jgi:Ser/Thr protein kinase RdoA (MazF antagonist)